MIFQTCLLEQLKSHPSIQPQDIVKLCYQAARGGEHLLQDPEKAWAYFRREFDEAAPVEGPLYETISPDICRINLRTWKKYALPPEWLFRMFLLTAGECSNGEARFLDYIRQAQELSAQLPFSRQDWDIYWENYQQAGMPAVHHSEAYRQTEHPSYRIVSTQLLRLLPILERAAKAKSGVIILEGRAASGKSTMANQLSAILEAPIIRMDDFFLPPVLRTPERFAQPGGNVHYERFTEEVLPYLRSSSPFSYRRFDCGSMDYQGEFAVPAASWRIVEGSYSLHPDFGQYGTITVFSHVSPEEQMARILNRNGAELAKIFKERWIPLEETYFETFHIKESADLVL